MRNMGQMSGKEHISDRERIGDTERVSDTERMSGTAPTSTPQEQAAGVTAVSYTHLTLPTTERV